MRLSSRITLLALMSAVLVLGVTGVAAAKGGPPKPLPPQSNSPLVVAGPEAAPAASGGGATTQQGGCQTSDVIVVGSGNLVLTPDGTTNFVCKGTLPPASDLPARPVKFDGDECDTVLTPSGRVRTICHSR